MNIGIHVKKNIWIWKCLPSKFNGRSEANDPRKSTRTQAEYTSFVNLLRANEFIGNSVLLLLV